MKSSLSWGILGTGGIASKFAEQLPHSKTGKLVAVASREETKGREFAGKFGNPKAYGSYEALLADSSVEAVYISTPHPQHARWVIAAAEAGKHILCEKPLTMNHAEAMVVTDAARYHGVVLMEAFMYRFHPNTRKFADFIREGAIGTPRHMEASFCFKTDYNPESRLFKNALGGGGILDVGCYTASVARLVAGAAAGKAFANPIEVRGSAALCDTGVDTIAAATMKFSGGLLAQLVCGVGLNHECVCRVYGDEGSLVFHDFWSPGSRIEWRRDGKDVETIALPGGEYLYALEADAVAEGLPTLEHAAISMEDTLGNMQALDQWRESAGVIYEMEKPGSVELSLTVAGRVFQPSRLAQIPQGRIPGLDQTVSRLVLGLDNQRTAPHMFAMADDFAERGGSVFDTAYIYSDGLQERLLGAWMQSRNNRTDVTVIAKGAHTPFCDPVSLTKQFELSLERLQTDYADIYMMHRDNLDIPVGEFVDAMDELRKKGQLRVFGGSNWSLERVREANAYADKHGRARFAVVSNNFSLARMVEPVWGGCISSTGSEWRSWFLETGTALLAWSSQARGFFLEDRPANWDAQNGTTWNSEDNFERRQRALQLAKENNVRPINIALAYVLAQPIATFALIGPRTVEETRTSLPGAQLALTPAEVAWLNLES